MANIYSSQYLSAFHLRCIKLHRKVYFVALFTDIDECQKDKQLCGEYGHCVNKKGSYQCDCAEGFKFNDDSQKCEGKNVLFLPLFQLLTILS